MVLVDTSVWITHLREGNENLKILSLPQSLPKVPMVSQEELLYFIDSYKLMARGIGFVDAHLLASSCLSKTPLWTKDKKLLSAAIELRLSYTSHL